MLLVLGCSGTFQTTERFDQSEAMQVLAVSRKELSVSLPLCLADMQSDYLNTMWYIK